jgi:hypothetical protein
VLVSIVSNLVDNAIKYMGDVSVRQIVLRARRRGSKVRVEVVDTGPGIAKNLQQRIFEPHVRGGPTAAPGLGLGLATVRRLAGVPPPDRIRVTPCNWSRSVLRRASEGSHGHSRDDAAERVEAVDGG